MKDLVRAATGHLKAILRDALHMAPSERALVIFDTQAHLSRILTEAYRQVLPTGRFVDFETVTPADIMRLFDDLAPGDLVVLIQSTNFRLDEFRVRIELFKRGLKTIEHIHLNRMSEPQFASYVEALAYDPNYYRPLGHALKSRLDRAERVVVACKGTELVYAGPMEEAKLNIGDYAQMKNIGGTFPIGEVFTEPRDLRLVNGEALVFAFAGEDFIVHAFTPFPVTIRDGILTAPQGPPEFQAILEKIRKDEEVLVREFGLGINPAMDKRRMVNDITAFERQKGLHLSLGAKHGIYAKPGLNRKHGRYHVDVFIDAERIFIDDELVYQDGNFR
jgi:hypothetical protein